MLLPKPGAVFPNWDTIHPIARGAFMCLADDLAKSYGLGLVPVLFKPFELYRDPARQLEMKVRGTSRALPFQSAHQFGLAVDFVPYVKEKWTWQVPSSAWDFLRKCANNRRLLNELDWDRAHVEHPAFRRVKAAFAEPTGSVNAATESERPSP